MRRLVGVALLAIAAGGCTSVKMVQRDGCWVRRTEKVFGRVVEDIGPCVRPQPQWSQDRLTRLVQECAAQADHRWQVRAMEAWSKKAPSPPQPPQQEIQRSCMEEARTVIGTETDAGTLRTRVAELSAERDALRSEAERDRAKLQESHHQIAEWLGQAAQKPPGNASAFATSSSTNDGIASNESGATLASESGSSPGRGGRDSPRGRRSSSLRRRPRRPPPPPPRRAPATPAAPPASDPGKTGPAAVPPEKPATAGPADPKLTTARAKEARARRATKIVRAARRDGCDLPHAAPCDPAPSAEAGRPSGP